MLAAAPKPFKLAVLPLPIGGGAEQRVVRPECQHVNESQVPDASDLARDSMPEPARWLRDDERADIVGK